MICQRIGLSPISTRDLCFVRVHSARRLPRPPATIATLEGILTFDCIECLIMTLFIVRVRVHFPRYETSLKPNASGDTGPACLERILLVIVRDTTYIVIVLFRKMGNKHPSFIALTSVNRKARSMLLHLNQVLWCVSNSSCCGGPR